MRDKRRARRGRLRRSRAEHNLEVWAAWSWDRREYGWPHESSEVRAYHRAKTKTVTNGEAAYRGRVQMTDDEDEDGRTVPRDPPPMPKETRPAAGSRVPEFDLARLGPHVNRLLLDMDEMGLFREASVVRACALYPRMSHEAIAAELGMSVRTLYRCKRRGMAHLEVVMSYEPRR